MIIANKVLLDDFVQTHANAVKPLNKWIEEVRTAQWTSHMDLKKMFPSADYIKNGRYVFNIGGNNYRVVAVVVFVAGGNDHSFCGNPCGIQ